MIIDCHCHYTFTARAAARGERFRFEPEFREGQAALDSFIAPRALRRITWRALRRMLGVPPQMPPGVELDAALERVYQRHLLDAEQIERFVLLAFDEYHDVHGRRAAIPRRADQLGSDIYTSNSLVRAACRQHARRFLFGASVHPYRADALDALVEVFEAGACLLKWLPLHQNIDVFDPRSVAALRRCGELGLPLLVHYSEEFTLATQHREFLSLTALLELLSRLRRRGERLPTVIVAHVATPVTPLGELRSHAALLDALQGEFADAPLYADISALAAFGKVEFLHSIARRQALHAKLLFGSDFPIPSAAARLRWALGSDYAGIRAEPSWPQQALRIFRACGFNEIVFQRAAQILPNVDYFATANQPATSEAQQPAATQRGGK